jgi:hypothetical protein
MPRKNGEEGREKKEKKMRSEKGRVSTACSLLRGRWELPKVL